MQMVRKRAAEPMGGEEKKNEGEKQQQNNKMEYVSHLDKYQYIQDQYLEIGYI